MKNRGSRNAFADLGYADARRAAERSEGPARQISSEQQTKLRLAYALNSIIDERNCRAGEGADRRSRRASSATRKTATQAAAAAKLGLNQPKNSALRNYKLDGFSVERLMILLTALDRDVEIVIRRKPRLRATAKISVVAA